jgi:tetratricopeptide (TPR) repeat protein
MKTDNQNSEFKTFRNYYTGNMSTEEKVAFENHLEEDPFAKEAYEGFLFLKDDHARISAIENTNMVLKEKFGITTSSTILPLKYALSIAASLVLFICSYFIIQSNLVDKKQNFSDNHVEKTSITEIIVEESNITDIIDSPQENLLADTISFTELEENVEEIIEKDLDKIQSKDVIISDVKKPTKKKVASSPIIVPAQVADAKQIGNNEFDYYRNLKTENKDNSDLVTEQPIGIDANKSQQLTNTIYADDSEVTEPENLEDISEYKKGIIAYNKSEYIKAIEHFNYSINRNKNLSGSNYYIAMSYFNQNKSIKAIKYFDITINRNSSFKDNAMWYKSLTLLNRGKKIEGKNLLKQISNSNSIFKTAALKKLESLD